MLQTAVLSRAYSTNLKGRIKIETGLEIPEHHIYVAFRPEDERERLIELTQLLEKQMAEKAADPRDDRSLVQYKSADKTTFWRRFIEVYDDRLDECRAELNAIIIEGRTGPLNTTNILTRLRHKSSKLTVFLDKYYAHLPTSCYLYKPHAFDFNGSLDFIGSCSRNFGLEEMKKRGEVPSVLKMLKVARLYFGQPEETDPLVTILADLQVPDWKHEALANDAQFVFLDLDSFKDCASTVMYEIEKMDLCLKSVLLINQHPNFDTAGLENPQWNALKVFLNEWKFDTQWDVLHPDVGFGAVERQSYLQHFKKEDTFAMYGREDKSATLEQIPSMFPENFCGVYFVGNRDCRRIARHTVPRRENNIIVYRYLEDLYAAHEISGQVSGTQFWSRTRAYYDDVHDDTSESVDM
ncbi:unnamed protein product [Bursaphelenchus xylophilus]|uniref:(pine wood nematode) hypothetical protein n=1 Tax=Bursaphelenchus xylophilus TaxID=6326 RepID=A0A1I7SCZ6_BURXY|nr:unnamed protein product [Bursaphelenchus xylophilus]CAG9093194.1 unnamed protein product [Bursaphelenchus xylophilus]